MKRLAPALLALAAVTGAVVARADEHAGSLVQVRDRALATRTQRDSDASVVAYVPPPAGTRHGTPHVVVLLHGWESCAPGMVLRGEVLCGGHHTQGYALGAEVDRSGTDTLLLVPQLAMLVRDSSPGRLGESGFAVHWLRNTLDAVAREAGGDAIARFRDAPVVLAAHSGGYQTLLAMIHMPHVAARTDSVVLFDGLYTGSETLVRWASAEPHRRVVSIHTGGATTTSESAHLVELARAARIPSAEGDDVTTALAGARVVSVRTRATHGDVPRRHFAEVLTALAR